MESVTQKSCNLFSAVMILHIWALEHFKVLCFQTWWTINNQHVRKSTLEFFLRLFACPTTQGVSGGWKARQESLQHRRLENIWQFFLRQNDGNPCTCLLLHWGVCCAWGNSSCTWTYLKSKFRCRWSWKTSGSEGWGPLCSIVSLQKVAIEWGWIWFPIIW